MKIKKSHLKELIRQSIREIDFKNKAEFDAYSKKHKMRKSTKVNVSGKDTTAGEAGSKKKASKDWDKHAQDAAATANAKMDKDTGVDVGGPAHANVPKGAKTSKQAKAMMKKKAGSKELPLSKWSDDKKDWEKQHSAVKDAKPIDKSSIKDFNQRSQEGDPVTMDTERYGMVSWAQGDPDEKSFFATDEDGDEIEIDYDDVVRVYESIGKRKHTIKEIQRWMKTLEENRYKRVYNSDCRRVAWMTNHIGENLETMPISMRKKWTKAEYGRERHLANEFLKSQKAKMNEIRLRNSIRNILIKTKR